MKDTPILMQRAMVRATLADLKTHTRRTRGLDTINADPDAWELRSQGLVRGAWSAFLRRDGDAHAVYCPYGAPGGRLWVRETWKPWPNTAGAELRGPDGDGAIYAATWDKSGGHHWKPSIHMPRKFSRIALDLLDVRIERVQNITKEDAMHEGITSPMLTDTYTDMRQGFAQLWDEINAKRGYGWARNPWVWVLVFRRVAPIT